MPQRELPFDFGTYRKRLKKIYKTIKVYAGVRPSSEAESELIKRAILRDVDELIPLDRTLISHVISLYHRPGVLDRETLAAIAVKTASYSMGELPQTYVGVGRILKIQEENGRVKSTISPLFAESPSDVFHYEEDFGSGNSKLASRSGVPLKLASLIRGCDYWEGILIGYVVDGIKRTARLVSGSYKPLIPYNVKLVYSKIGMNSRKPYPCTFCGRIHNGKSRSWCDGINDTIRTPISSFESFLSIKQKEN